MAENWISDRICSSGRFRWPIKGSWQGVLLKNGNMTSYSLPYLRGDGFSLVTGIGTDSKPIS